MTWDKGMKKLNIHVTCGEKKDIFVCSTEEFISRVKSHFGLYGDIVFYKVFKGKKTKIDPTEIRDLMSVEVELRKNSTRSIMNGQKFLDDYEIGECSKSLTKTELLLKKLLENKTLSGIERKNVIELIENRHLPKVTGKRKRKEKASREMVPVAHKKIQVFIRDVKDSCAQTEPMGQENLNDSTTEEDLIVKMKKMATLEHIDKTIVADLMQKTYNERRKYILSKRPPVKSTRDKYPLLFSFEEVKNELERIFNFGKCHEFLENIEKYAPCILQNADKGNAIYKSAKRNIQNANSEAQSKYIQKVGALLLLPLALEERLEFLRLLNQPNISDNFPCIHVPTQELKELFLGGAGFKIVVEGITLCTVETFPEAMLCLMASFYLFNISYSPNCFRTLVTMEKLFLAGNETEEIDTFTSQMIKYFKLKASRC